MLPWSWASVMALAFLGSVVWSLEGAPRGRVLIAVRVRRPGRLARRVRMDRGRAGPAGSGEARLAAGGRPDLGGAARVAP